MKDLRQNINKPATKDQTMIEKTIIELEKMEAKAYNKGKEAGKSEERNEIIRKLRELRVIGVGERHYQESMGLL